MTFLLAGLAFGLAAGVSPGPLQTLVLTATMRRGFAAGWRVAVAPLVTDAPVIFVAVAVLSSVPGGWLRVLGAAGGLVVIAVGARELRGSGEASPDETLPAGGSSGDLWRGVAVNILSPHPWVFWAGLGGPALIGAWRSAPVFGILFLLGFYFLLVGSKIAFAAAVSAGRGRLSPVWRRRMVLVGGSLLVGGGVIVVIGSVRPG